MCEFCELGCLYLSFLRVGFLIIFVLVFTLFCIVYTVFCIFILCILFVLSVLVYVLLPPKEILITLIIIIMVLLLQGLTPYILFSVIFLRALITILLL